MKLANRDAAPWKKHDGPRRPAGPRAARKLAREHTARQPPARRRVAGGAPGDGRDRVDERRLLPPRTPFGARARGRRGPGARRGRGLAAAPDRRRLPRGPDAGAVARDLPERRAARASGAAAPAEEAARGVLSGARRGALGLRRRERRAPGAPAPPPPRAAADDHGRVGEHPHADLRRRPPRVVAAPFPPHRGLLRRRRGGGEADGRRRAREADAGAPQARRGRQRGRREARRDALAAAAALRPQRDPPPAEQRPVAGPLLPDARQRWRELLRGLLRAPPVVDEDRGRRRGRGVSRGPFYRDRFFTALRDTWDRGDDDAAIAARRNRSITATIARMSILGHHHKDPSQTHLCEPPQAI